MGDTEAKEMRKKLQKQLILMLWAVFVLFIGFEGFLFFGIGPSGAVSWRFVIIQLGIFSLVGFLIKSVLDLIKDVC